MEPALLLYNDAARHPVRRAFPPPAPMAPIVPHDPWQNTRLFLMTFCAGFMAFYGLIA